jgi:hypothetical protein
MYIVAIGWLYVVVLMALSESTLTAGFTTFLLFGALPLGMLLIVRNGSKRSRRRRREALERANSADDATHEPPAQ